MRTLFFASSLLVALSASAQSADYVDAIINVDEAAMIRAVNAQGLSLTDLTFNIAAPGVVGAPFAQVPSQTMYLQYTSVKGAAPDDQRQISVDVIGGDFPAGVSLSLAANPAGTGSTGLGQEVTLTNSLTSAVLLSGLGSAYSGTSAGQGIPVTYVLNYATENLDASTAGVVSLQFTISNI
ncbi:MAG: hypothetical protein ACKOX0_05300 [Bacteroidota bacterium]|jgi:hypothetical protein